MIKKTTLVLTLLLLTTIVHAQWTQIGTDIDGEAINDASGESVCLNADGSIVAIGARRNEGNGVFAGHTRIYQNQSGNWIQIGNDIDGEEANNGAGASVSLSADGSIVAIGATGNDGNGSGSGHVQVFKNISGNWSQIGSDIDGEAAFDHSGISISLNSEGSIIAIGATRNTGNGTDAGHVRVYENQNDTWVQIGDDLDGEAAGDFFGRTVSLNSDGSIVAIGAPYNDGNGDGSGHARIYENQGGTWMQIGDDIDGEAAGDTLNSVSINADGSVVAIGGQGNDGNGIASGHVRVFENINGIWTQKGNDIDGEEAFDNSGRPEEVSLNSDGTIVAIGAVGNNGNGSFSGHVRVFQYANDLWVQVGMDIDGEAENDMSGDSVSLSADGSVVAIGAPFNDGNGDESGHVRVYNNPALSVIDTESIHASIYPNPVQNTLNISANFPIEKVQIYTLQGQLILQTKNNQIDVSLLSSGLYFASIMIDGKSSVKKFIKN